MWLLLHFVDLAEEEVEGRRLENTGKMLKKAVKAYLPGYSETSFDFGLLQPHIEIALQLLCSGIIGTDILCL